MAFATDFIQQGINIIEVAAIESKQLQAEEVSKIVRLAICWKNSVLSPLLNQGNNCTIPRCPLGPREVQSDLEKWVDSLFLWLKLSSIQL